MNKVNGNNHEYDTVGAAIKRQLEILGKDPATPIGKLENWSLIDFGRPYLVGDIVDHPVHGTRADSATSRVLHLDRDVRYAITVNSAYRLIGPEVTVGQAS